MAAGDAVGGGEEAAAALEQQRQVAVSVATAREGLRRVEAMAADADPARRSRRGSAPAYPRWGWRRALRFAVDHRMLGPEYLRWYGRLTWHRARHPEVEFQGMAFLGRDVDLVARPGHGRLVLGPWCWIGHGNSIRAHEGNVRLGAKVVLGANNVINGYLDVEVGAETLLSDWVYVCDFDHRYADPLRPIRKQGIRKSPVRIGEDVWVGEKVSILRGADIGAGSVIGAQTVVKGAIPPFSIVVGAPARVLGSRLPQGLTAEEALDLRRRGLPVPGDPLAG